MNERDIERVYLARFGIRLEPGMRRYVLDSLRTGQPAPGLGEAMTVLGEVPPPAAPGGRKVVGLGGRSAPEPPAH